MCYEYRQVSSVSTRRFTIHALPVFPGTFRGSSALVYFFNLMFIYIFFVFLCFLFLSMFLSFNACQNVCMCVCRACRIQYDDTARLSPPVLCLLHNNVVPLSRSFVATELVVYLSRIEDSPRGTDWVCWTPTSRNNGYMRRNTYRYALPFFSPQRRRGVRCPAPGEW